MEATCHRFGAASARALADEQLQQALRHLRGNFVVRRAQAAARLPEFDSLRDAARAIKDEALEHLDLYLERFAAKVEESGGIVHWCSDAAEARAVILDICRGLGARTVTKGKSMVSEEIGLNDHLAAHGIEPIETDLGEYIIQLRGETPSHLIAPAIHVTRAQVADAFRAAHTDLDPARSLDEPATLLAEARDRLRQRFLAADVGITGANFLVAETGSTVIVTNEGNGDLTQTLPKAHIVLAGIEKVVPTLEDVATILRVLARSATGQEMSVYTTLSTGPRRAGDRDGPAAFHVVLLDNGRVRMLGSEFREALRCIRCGACLNGCPVYQAIGGHAYGWVYGGPIGAVLSPAFLGLAAAPDLPQASSLCGRCEDVCPVRIPLPRLLRRWREVAFAARIGAGRSRVVTRAWVWLARRPRLYRLLTGLAARLLGFAGRREGAFRFLPFASGWTATRDFPAPEGRTFHSRWQQRERP